MQYDMNGNIIENEHIETDRKFWMVPVTINSVVWESGYHIYEAKSMDEALEMYESEKELPIDIEYTGWQDQEYRYDELDGDDPEQLDSNGSEVQDILRQEKKNEEWLARAGGEKE
jgi:hypothetical protein